MLSKYLPNAVMLVLMLWFGCRAFEGARGGAPLDPDASRHMMNGAFLSDMVRTGGWAHPVQFAHTWYARLPVLSLPYHPPGFPIVEALFFGFFGVHYWVARLCVALAVALCVFFMVRLVAATHGSYILAFASVLILFSTPTAMWLASDVMLEFPSLVLVLAALFFLRDLALQSELTWSRAGWFSLLASAAIWTKQDAVFLVGVPWLLIGLNGSWHVLRRGAIWMSSFTVLAAFAVIMLLPVALGVGINHSWHARTLSLRVPDHAVLYFHAFLAHWGWFGVLLPLGLGTYLYLVKRHDARIRPANFFLAWMIAAILLRLVQPPRDPRYAFSWEPALIVFTLSMLPRRRFTGATLLSGAVLYFALRAQTPSPHLYGFDAAARMAAGPGRTVCFGPNTGGLISAMRAADPLLQSTSIRGERLPESAVDDAFFHRYGMTRIVTVDRVSPWNTRLRGEIPIRSSDQRQGATLRVYDYLNPARQPDNNLDVSSSFSSAPLHVTLP